jgi:hypothetical protein
MAPRPTKDQRLKLLLEKGYFPRELPPPFHTVEFAKFRRYLQNTWNSANLEKYSSIPENYSIPRHHRSRRKLCIVNPVSQFKVSKLIADNWNDVRKFLSKSKISEFKPVFDISGDRCFFDIDFISIETRTAEILSLHNSALKSDISRYFSTIYTHSVPWAMYGKNYCKSNRFTPQFRQTFGNLLDKYIRQCQDDQSIGIPIGHETSRVVGEIIGTALEQRLMEKIDDLDQRGLRYVDDIVIGYNSNESADTIVSELQRAFTHFELEMNVDKTKIHGVGETLQPEWIIPIRRSYQRGIFISVPEIEEYFKTSSYLAQVNPMEGVIKYALKRSRGFRFDKKSWTYYQNWIIRITRKHSDCLPLLAQILIEKRYEGYNIDNTGISKYINEALILNIDLHHSFEVAWLLFIAKGLSIKITNDIEHKIISMNNSACSLLFFDLGTRNLLLNPIQLNNWASIYTQDGLRDERWLFVYEATVKGWMSNNPCFVDSDTFFGPIKKKKISFYDTTSNVTRTRKELSIIKTQRILSRIIFSRIDEYF